MECYSGVSFNQLNDLEQTAGRLPEGWKYVLPTEAQWEYACRAGTNTHIHEEMILVIFACQFSGSGFSQTKDVGQYSPNLWGFFDMHGNVWEYVYDWKEQIIAKGPQTDQR